MGGNVGDAIPDGNYPAIPRSYSANTKIIANPDWYGNTPVTMSIVKAPTTRIMVSEAYWSGMGWSDWGGSRNFANWKNESFAGHLGTWNCLYADGHVKSMRPTATMTPVNQWGRMDDNIDPDVAGCNDVSSRLDWINCEVTAPNAVKGLDLLTKKYQ